jgi:hypothetical protein
MGNETGINSSVEFYHTDAEKARNSFLPSIPLRSSFFQFVPVKNREKISAISSNVNIAHSSKNICSDCAKRNFYRATLKVLNKFENLIRQLTVELFENIQRLITNRSKSNL